MREKGARRRLTKKGTAKTKELTDWPPEDGLLPVSRWFSCSPGNANGRCSVSVGACPLPLGCEEDATICPFFVFPFDLTPRPSHRARATTAALIASALSAARRYHPIRFPSIPPFARDNLQKARDKGTRLWTQSYWAPRRLLSEPGVTGSAC